MGGHWSPGGQPSHRQPGGRIDTHRPLKCIKFFFFFWQGNSLFFKQGKGTPRLNKTLYNKMTKDGQEEKKLSYRHKHTLVSYSLPYTLTGKILTWRADRTWIPNSTHTQLVCWLLPHWFACCPFQKIERDRPPRPFSYRNEFFSPFVFTSITKAKRERDKMPTEFSSHFFL